MRSSVGKALEHRSALTPTTAKALIDAGYTVNVERSPERIFDDSEFEKVGATLVPENTWREAPTDHIIIGLKELPVEECESAEPSDKTIYLTLISPTQACPHSIRPLLQKPRRLGEGSLSISTRRRNTSRH
jgi:NAD/NADP transhydrogenase alpha subunit